jgi:hypothetical protein
METETLCPPEDSRPEQSVSPALLPQSPGRVMITNRRRQEVPLTLAGYRLRLGATYYVCVAGPVKEIRLVGFPRMLVRRQGEPEEITDNSGQWHRQALYVQRAGFWSMVTNLGLYPEELELEVILQDGRKVSAVLPVVLELSFTWKLVLLLILWAALGSLYEVVSAALREQRVELLASPLPWIKALLLALLYPILTFVRRVWGLGKRARELQQQFLANNV